MGGTLFSVWTKIPETIDSYPFKRGDLDVYVLRGKNWNIRCLVAFIEIDAHGRAIYNANSMVFGLPPSPVGIWAGDYSFAYLRHGMTPSKAGGWVWTAWQVVVNRDSLTLRQWLKFGKEGRILEYSSRPTFGELRRFILEEQEAADYGGKWTKEQAESWIPSDAISFQVGKDHGYLYNARMEARKSKPTLRELKAIASSTAPDDTAWAVYDLTWKDGKPGIKDLSGHGRDLVIAPGGALRPGVVFPY